MPPQILPFSFGKEVINQGQLGQLVCTVLQGDEPISLSWSLHGEDLADGPDLTTTQIGTRTSILLISSVSYRHTGSYTCTASNPAGSVSHAADLKVNGNNNILIKVTGRFHNYIYVYIYIFLEPPEIMEFSFGNKVVNQGELRQIICSVIKGDEPLTISWSLQGEDLGPGPDLTTTQLGSRSSLLMISSVSYRHSGTYTCTASNAAGSQSHSALLKVNGIIKIILSKGHRK